MYKIFLNLLSWSDIQSFFEKLWEDFITFWFTPPVGQTPYFAKFLFAFAFLFIGYFLIKIIIRVLRKIFKLNEKRVDKDRAVKQFLVSTINVIAKFALVVFFLILLGADLSGLTTIISSGILAIGLSLQEIIGNFASGIVILSSKPFAIGDYIFVDGEEGTVKDIRFLTVVLRTADNQEIIIPNKIVTNSPIRNFTKVKNRRIKIDLSVVYGSDVEKVRKVVLGITSKEKRVLTDPAAYVAVAGFGANGVTLSLRCYSLSKDYWDTLFAINEKIYNEFNKNGIEFAFTTITVKNEDLNLKEDTDEN
ncbi:MAG TPA: mechanosensitive ion channel family protein [Candidatus Onthovivens sp.]|nr:mechanosensitive ion channel family protein [Candidatus Onthovivens sp.]